MIQVLVPKDILLGILHDYLDGGLNLLTMPELRLLEVLLEVDAEFSINEHVVNIFRGVRHQVLKIFEFTTIFCSFFNISNIRQNLFSKGPLIINQGRALSPIERSRRLLVILEHLVVDAVHLLHLCRGFALLQLLRIWPLYCNRFNFIHESFD